MRKLTISINKGGVGKTMFVKSLSAAAAGCLLRGAHPVLADVSGMTFGVQLYMLRRQAQNDLAGAFRAIHDAGFPQVELYPIAYSHPAAEIRRMMQDAGLGAIAGHFDYAGLEVIEDRCTPSIAQSTASVLRRFFRDDVASGNHLVLTQNRGFQLYQKLIQPAETSLCGVWPELMGFQVVSVARAKIAVPPG